MYMPGSRNDPVFKISVNVVENYNGSPALIIRRVIKDPEIIQIFLNSVLSNPEGFVTMKVPKDKAVMAALELIRLGVIQPSAIKK